MENTSDFLDGGMIDEIVSVYAGKGYDARYIRNYQRNKSETIFFVIKQIMTEKITSRNHTTQTNKMLLRLVAYNSYRITKLDYVILVWFLQGRIMMYFRVIGMT